MGLYILDSMLGQSITPGPMLAHEASRQGKVAAEVIAGEPAAYDNRVVPAVVFTDPEPPHASDLISEAALAIEMGATLEDIAATIHPHPTLGEALMEAAEVALGTVVHINPPRTPKAREKAGAKA